jgi:hypothetical protein
MSVADLDGISFQHDDDEWIATVTLTVLDANQNPVEDAKVFYTWSNNKDNDCTTDSNGQCSLTSDKLKNVDYSDISFSVDDITHDEVLLFSYDADGNSDPDDDSDGTVITINSP